MLSSSTSVRSCKLLIAALAASLAAGCAVDSGEPSTGEAAAEAPPGGGGDTNPNIPGLCPTGRVLFDGLCRWPAFFERFLSEGAVLISVSGPRSASDDDTGVVVLEALSDNSYNLLYMSPDEIPDEGPYPANTPIRARYPMEFEQVVTTWQDDDGFLNMFIEDRGPSYPHFGTVAWRHFAATASGYRILDSDGGLTVAQASGGEGDYCDLASSAAKTVATGVCMGGALVGGALSGAAVGILSGAAVVVVATSATFGVGGPEALLGGIATGVTVGAAWFAGVVGAGAVVCGPLGELIEEGVDTLVCDDTPEQEAEFEFLPMVPSTPIFPDPLSNQCPSGMVRYTGRVTSCSSSNGTVFIPGEGDVESVEVTCIVKNVVDQCAYI